MLRFLINLFLTGWLSLLAASVIQSHRQVDWSGVKGAVFTPGKEAPPNLLDRMEQAAWRGNAALELSEADVNRYLACTLTGAQHGPSQSLARFERVILDFEPGTCRACFEWKLLGGKKYATAAIEFTVERRGGDFIIEPRRGAYGRLPVLRGMMCALMPALHSLCGALDSEIKTVFQMNQIRFEADKVVLDPRSEASR